ncbi:MAG: hypothetical protein ACJ8CB_25490 [Ktedonobacteraceae bacterium]
MIRDRWDAPHSLLLWIETGYQAQAALPISNWQALSPGISGPTGCTTRLRQAGCIVQNGALGQSWW